LAFSEPTQDERLEALVGVIAEAAGFWIVASAQVSSNAHEAPLDGVAKVLVPQPSTPAAEPWQPTIAAVCRQDSVE